jgi:hypothetical protein
MQHSHCNYDYVLCSAAMSMPLLLRCKAWGWDVVCHALNWLDRLNKGAFVGLASKVVNISRCSSVVCRPAISRLKWLLRTMQGKQTEIKHGQSSISSYSSVTSTPNALAIFVNVAMLTFVSGSFQMRVTVSYCICA